MAKKPPLKLQWWNGRPNFGDALSPLVVGWVAGREIVHTSKDEMEILSTGSIMIRAARGFKEPRDHRPVIWGTGMMSPVRTLFVPHVDFAAVRGPITRTLLDLPPLPYGDPGLLVERMAKNDVSRGDHIGLIPHHGDFKDSQTKKAVAAAADRDDVTLIDPRTEDVFAVADAIRACRHVYSSSLHGLILADAFGIPNTWVAGRAIHTTAGLKFMDYFNSIGRPYADPISYEAIPAAKDTISDPPPYGDAIEATKDALIAAFPEHLKA